MIIGLFVAEFGDWFPERAALIATAAADRGVQVLFFAASGLDLDTHTVLGSLAAQGEWQQKRLPIPSAIVDLRPGGDGRSPGAEALRRHAVFVAGTMPASDDELRRLLQHDSPLRPSAEPPHDPEGGERRFRIALSRSAADRWRIGAVAPLYGDAAAELAAASDKPHAAAPTQPFPDAEPLLVSYLGHAAAELAAQIEEHAKLRLPSAHIDLAIDHGLRVRFVGAGIGSGASDPVPEAVAYAARLAKTDDAPSRPCLIGMLVGWALPETFLELCHQAALARGARFFYFHPKQVDADKRQIRGAYWRDGRWMKGWFPYPDVVYDRMRRRRERRTPGVYEALAGVPFTHRLNFGVFNKMMFYRMVSDDPRLARSIIPYRPLNRTMNFDPLLDRYPKLILKPPRGSNGRGILLAKRIGDDRYEITDETYMHAMSRTEFEELLRMLGGRRYVAQQFVESRTKEGYPFHIRVHLMRNREGKWDIAFIFPSFSLSPNRQVTNHAKTFRGVTRWEWFLDIQFGQTPGGSADTTVRTFAREIADCLERRLGTGFHELGVDLGIDERGEIKLFETNVGDVGMKFHEYEAAKHGIEYALFVAASANAPKTHPDSQSKEQIQ